MSAATTILSRVLLEAAGELGTTESPAGSNRVKYWLETKPAWNGYAWCAAFVTAMFLREGVDLRKHLTNPYYCPNLVQWAIKNGYAKVSGPNPGDIVLYGTNGYAVHTGIHERTISGVGYQAIEGNTSSGQAGSQNNGGGVYRRIRSAGWIVCWIDMRQVVADLIASGEVKPPAEPKPPVGRTYTAADVKELQKLVKVTVDGQYGPITQSQIGSVKRVAYHLFDPKQGAPTVTHIKATQRICGVTVDGIVGPVTTKAVNVLVKELQAAAYHVTADGDWGRITDGAYTDLYRQLYKRY